MWEVVEITIGIIFFFLFEICIHYFLYREFHLKKNHPQMINFFSECGDKLFPIKCELWVEVPPWVIRIRFQDFL